MPEAYQGHASYSSAKAAAAGTAADADTTRVVAAADHPGYNPKAAEWLNEPGAAARAQGYPRSDGK